MRPIATEVRSVSGWVWEEGTGEDQGWYASQDSEFKKLKSKTGRDKWFEQTCAYLGPVGSGGREMSGEAPCKARGSCVGGRGQPATPLSR